MKSAMVQKMVPYSIVVIAEYNLSGSKIICRQISQKLQFSQLLNQHGTTRTVTSTAQ